MSESFPTEFEPLKPTTEPYPSIEFNSGSLADPIAVLEGAAGFVELSTIRTTKAFLAIRSSLEQNLQDQGVQNPKIGLSALGSRMFDPNYLSEWPAYVNDGIGLVPTSFDMPDVSTFGNLFGTSAKELFHFPQNGLGTVGNLAKNLGWYLLCVKDHEAQESMMNDALLHWHDAVEAIDKMRFGIRVHSEQIYNTTLLDEIYRGLVRNDLLHKAYLSIEISHLTQSPSEWIEFVKSIKRAKPDLKIAASGDISHVQQSMTSRNMDGTAYETLSRILADPNAPEFSGIELHSWDGNSGHVHGSLQELNANGLADLFLAYGASAARKNHLVSRIPSNAIVETVPLSSTKFLGTPEGATWLKTNVMDPYNRGFNK